MRNHSQIVLRVHIYHCPPPSLPPLALFPTLKIHGHIHLSTKNYRLLNTTCPMNLFCAKTNCLLLSNIVLREKIAESCICHFSPESVDVSIILSVSSAEILSGYFISFLHIYCPYIKGYSTKSGEHRLSGKQFYGSFLM